MTTERKRHTLPNDLAKAVQLARFAAEYKIDPADVAQLVVLARKAFNAGERSCNSGTEAAQRAYDRATDAFEELAGSLGFKVQWPGLWPTLRTQDGRSVYDLPV
jgi:hypothetical protein